MRVTRRKVSAPFREFNEEIDRLLKLDAANQRALPAVGVVARNRGITNHQLKLLTETIFFAGFRAYEGFLGDVFLLYCLEKPRRSGTKVKSYLRPKNFDHAGSLVRSSMNFLEWNSPDLVIERAETYLDEGFPIKAPYTTNRVLLADLKKIRNHIAHNSSESLDKYKAVVKKHFGVIPLSIPEPGAFLLLQNQTDRTKYNLVYYLEFLKKMALEIT